MPSSRAVGSRTFAVRDAKDGQVNAFGYGTYVGDHPRPGSGNWSDEDMAMAVEAIRSGDADPLDFSGFYDQQVADGKMTRAEVDAVFENAERRNREEQARPIEDRARDLLARMALNPKIELDDGGVVWGCECWWMPEDKAESFINGRPVVIVAPTLGV